LKIGLASRRDFGVDSSERIGRECGMPSRSSKRPRDPNQLAKFIVDLATGEDTETLPQTPSTKNPAAVALGRLGGRKGGKARAAALSAELRREIAQKAAAARWHRDC
jgi:hypothetical protein